MEKSDQNVSSDEKILAGFAYLLGFIPAILIWFLKKDDSPYVNFQAMQAALYCGMVSSVTALLLAVGAILIVIMMAGAFIGTNVIADTLRPENPLIYLVLTMIMAMIIIAGFGITAFFWIGLKLVNLIASVFVFNGKDWRYPVIGDWIFRMIKNGVLP